MPSLSCDFAKPVPHSRFAVPKSQNRPYSASYSHARSGIKPNHRRGPFNGLHPIQHCGSSLKSFAQPAAYVWLQTSTHDSRQDDSAFKSTCISSFFLPFQSILRQSGVKQTVMCNSKWKRLKAQRVPPIRAPLFTGATVQKTLVRTGCE
jgi:hypothetical protein